MRGYLSFLLVLLGSLALAEMLAVYGAASTFDLSRPVAIERAYGLEMNAKETVIESVRAGAAAGFSEYDLAHDVRECIHCPDNACVPPNPADPLPPNYCDGERCSGCFRESEARAAALSGAEEMLRRLDAHDYDPDFRIGFGKVRMSAFLLPDPASRNGLRLSSLRFMDEFPLNISSDKFGLRREAGIPGGFSVDIG